MAKRALLVGINAYPKPNDLNGCLNDLDDMAAYLKTKHGFADADIQQIRDKQATTANIVKALEGLAASLKSGDQAVFHYSGHGAQMPTKTKGEVDGLDEVICPVDFDWSDEHAIRDDDFNRIFSSIPAGVELVWVSDSCHSGNLERAEWPRGIVSKARRILPPKAIQAEINEARKAGKAKVRALTAPSKLNVALISGCRSAQTSADAEIDSRFNGAATYYLLKALRQDPGAPLDDLVKAVDKALASAGYSQQPGTFGSHAIRGRAFLALEAVPV